MPFKAAYLSGKARVAQAQARLVQAEQDVARVKPLLEEQAVSRKNVDDAVAETWQPRPRWRPRKAIWSKRNSISTTR